jgi:hexulose-6-phosphate isomerase
VSWIAGINHWAMPGVPIREAAVLAKRAGFGAIELNLDEHGELGLGTTEADAQRIRSAVEAEGVQIGGVATGLYWRYSHTANDPGTRQRAQDITKKQLSLAAALGAGAILVVPGQVGQMMGGPIVRYDVAWQRAEEFLTKLVPEAESAGVVLAIENVWNKFLLSPLEMQRMVDERKSDAIGVYFDVGNILLYGYPQQWIEILGKRIARVHLKDFRQSVGTLAGFVDIGEGDVDWEAVGVALHAINYSGPLTAEVFPNEQAQANIEEYVARIGQHVNGVMQRMIEASERTK